MKFAMAILAITSATLVTWAATGRDAYAKFEVVERTEVEVALADFGGKKKMNSCKPCGE